MKLLPLIEGAPNFRQVIHSMHGPTWVLTGHFLTGMSLMRYRARDMYGWF